LKILIIRLSAIGDTIHTLPVAAEIKRRFPDAQVTWLVEPPSAPLLVNNPVVDRVIVLRRKSWLSGLTRPWRWPSVALEVKQAVDDLRRSQFDAVLDVQGLVKSAIWAAASGSPVRIGFAGAREGASALLTDKVDVGDYFGADVHVVKHHLKLADYLFRRLGKEETGAGGPQAASFPLPAVPAQAVAKVEALLDEAAGAAAHQDISMARRAVLVPGTTWPSKIWPPGSWTALGRLLADRLGFRICLAGGGGEAATNSAITRELRDGEPPVAVVDLTGKTSLLDLICLFQRADLVVGGDTGPLHLAAAVGKPRVVGVYGSTPAGRNGPYGPQCLTVNLGLWCQPCFEKICPLSTTACLKELTPETVLAAIEGHAGAVP